MTLTECKKEVALLGGDLAEKPFVRLLPAILRALYTLSCERPRIYSVVPKELETDAGRRVCRMESIDESFLCFAPSPVCPPTDYRIVGGNTLLLPDDGVSYRIFYRKRLPQYREEDGDAVLPLDDDMARLLPLIVAAEVYAEEDAELAAGCLALYRTEAAAIRGMREAPRTAFVGNTNGW